MAGSVCTIMAARALKKKNLSTSGTVAGVAVGFLLISCGLRGFTLIYFYQLGTWASRYGLALKTKYDATLQVHISRGATQVLCTSVIACALTVCSARERSG